MPAIMAFWVNSKLARPDTIRTVGFDADFAASVARSRLDTLAAMTPPRAAAARVAEGPRTKGERVPLKSTATSTRSRAAKAATAAELCACLSHCSSFCSDALSDVLRLDLLARSAPRILSLIHISEPTRR